MRFTWTFLAGAALLGAFALFAQIEAQLPARAQLFSAPVLKASALRAPVESSNPISRLPLPPGSSAATSKTSPAPATLKTPRPAKSPTALTTAKPLAASNLRPTATPLPTLGPRFAGQNPIRVGLSTAGGPLAIYAPDGATLFDLNQPRQVLHVPRATIFQLNFGPNRVTKGSPSLSGPISVAVAGTSFHSWQRVYIALKGDAARVSSNGANPKYGRPYRGDLEVFSQKLAEAVKRRGPLALVNVVPLESYLRGVVPWEMDATAPPEALKAQAICARTKVLDFKRTKRFAAGDFDVCDYDACQGYPGMENEKAATTQAVESTRGLAIYYGARPIDAVYSTNSGGITASADDAWPGGASIPYLQSVRDFTPDSPLGKLWQSGMTEAKWAQFCAGNFDSFAKPHGVAADKYEARKYRWTQFVSVEDATKAFAAEGISRVMQIQVMNRTPSGRIGRLRVTGVDAARFKAQPTPRPAPTPKPSEPDALSVSLPIKVVDLAGDGKIRALLSKRLGSTTALPSSLFTISPVVDASGLVSGWSFQGAGWGHGVGMCQRGAQNHARAGWDARRILGWYYRGVEIR